MSNPHPIAGTPKPPLWLSLVLGAILIALMGVLRLNIYGHRALPIGYGVPIILAGWFRNRKLLWSMAAVFAAMSLYKFFFILAPADAAIGQSQYDRVSGLLVLLDLAVVTALVDLALTTRTALENYNLRITEANRELAEREEEIARQNEELQSQTEELERQTEELRLSNEELAAREHMLEQLLTLSRMLAGNLTTAQVTDKICGVLGHLVQGFRASSAILELHGESLTVRCHNGFPGGPVETVIPFDRSFAALVMGLSKTGFVEDISLRPDVIIPQPRVGPKLRSVLATPLGLGGDVLGTLELYSSETQAWTQEQVNLVESLAAQASVSLEAARLFERIAEERERFQTVLRALPIGIIVADSQMHDIRANPAGAAILNIPIDANLAAPGNQPRGRYYRAGQALQPDDHPVSRAVKHGEDVLAEEIELLFTNGRRVSLLVSASPFRDRDGKVIGAVSSFVDITSQKNLQDELDARRREAEESSVRKTRFLAAVSHDIRTPANAINLLAELIRRASSNEAMAPEVPEMAGELQSSAVSLVNLVSDVLDVARYDSGKVELQESRFSLGDMLQQEVRQLQPLAQAKHLEIEAEPIAAALWLHADRIKLSRVIGNLLGNAIKFTDAGSVKVSAARTPDGAVSIVVKDTGVGIDSEHLPRIFDEFYQLRNPERDRNKGTGLGLAICKRLAEAMGGEITVDSRPGVGSAFIVKLPARAVTAEDGPAIPPSPAHPPAAALND